MTHMGFEIHWEQQQVSPASLSLPPLQEETFRETFLGQEESRKSLGTLQGW